MCAFLMVIGLKRVPAHGRSPPSARCTWSQSGRCADLAAPVAAEKTDMDTHTQTALVPHTLVFNSDYFFFFLNLAVHVVF